MNPLFPFPDRPCPVCAANAAKILYTQRFGVESPSLLQGYDVAVCGNCGCGYADHIPTQDEFDAYYREMSKYEYGHQAGQTLATDAARFQLTADDVELLRPDRNARILDIGCATGHLLKVLKARGYSNPQGVDPSPECARIARELHGVEVLTAPLSQLAHETARYDLILLLAVVEHLEDAKRSIAQVVQLLAPGGLFYVEVPDVSPFAAFENAPFQQFSVEHINFWSQISLDNLMASQGLEPVWHQSVVREAGYRLLDPGITAAYRATSEPPAQRFDESTAPALRAYIESCQGVENAIAARLQPLIDAQTPVVIWGLGTNTLHLLHATPLGRANIVAFVDSNPKYQGRSQRDRPVLSPAALPQALREIEAPIIIGSRMYQQEIEATIRQTLGLSDEIIKLYPV